MESKDPSTSFEDLLEKITEAVNREEDVNLTNEDKDTLRKIIKTYNMFLSWGTLGKVLIYLLFTAAGVITAFVQIMNWK